MEEKINLEDVDVEEKDYKNEHDKSLIDIKKDIGYPPVAISIGSVQYAQNVYPIPFGTLGNFSSLVGASKTKKTFFKALLTASYIGGSANNYAEDIKSHRDGEKYVLDFDTEQGDWHVQKSARRVIDIVGNDYRHYKPFMLREKTPKERVEFIEWCLFESHYKNKIGLVLIDGIADLVSNVNDLDQCNEVVQKLMTWSTLTNAHIIVVIHSNFDTKKATGHLGSSIMKKAETVCILELDKMDRKTTNVEFTYTRGYPIDPFAFSLDENSLPVTKRIESLDY